MRVTGEADDEAGEAAFGAGRTVRLPRARPSIPMRGDFCGGLHAALFKKIVARRWKEFAFSGSGTEGRDFDAVARDLSGMP